MNARATVLLMATIAAFAPAAPAEDQELVWKDGKWVKQPPPAEGTPAGELAIIRRDLDRKDYRRAVKHAKRFLKRYPNDPLAEQAYSLGGDAELRRRNYWQAYGWYDKQIREFSKGELLDRALERQIEVARAFLGGQKRKLGRYVKIPAEQNGIEILEKVAARAAGTDRAQIALLIIADYYLDRAKWARAAASYDNFLKLFPKSRRAAHAELHAAEAFHKAYRGPLHDETPLIEAEQRYQAFADSHPAKAREANVEEILRKIRSARAAKQYQVARFYLRTDKPDAAKYYFELVAREYAATRWAGRALGQLARLAKPAPQGETPADGGKGAQDDREAGS